MVQNIIFDVGMVLVNFRWKAFCRDLGFSREEIEVFGTRVVSTPLWNEFDRNVLPPDLIIDRFCEMLPEYTPQVRHFFSDISDLVRPFSGSKSWLKGLKGQGYHIYLLSNYSEFMWKNHSKKWDFLPYTDGAVVSYEVKINKPDAGIYQALLKKYDLCPEETIFLDDKAENIASAEGLGIAGILVKNQKQAQRELQSFLEQQEQTCIQ